MSKQAVWILGQGGFLGSELARYYAIRGDDVFGSTPIPWTHAQSRMAEFQKNIEQFSTFAKERDARIIWAAGSSGVGTQDEGVQHEFEAFSEFSLLLTGTSHLTNCSFYLCSSAGGVYALSPSPPFSSESPVQPKSEYGHLKRRMELLAQERLASKFPLTIGRISNLYGPWGGQRQGLINRLCLAALERKALNLFVPMSTVRDYLYISDAAQLISESAPPISVGEAKIEIVASGFSTTVATAVATVSHVSHRRVPLSIGTDSAAQEQPDDLRLIPTWREENPSFSPLDLAAGAMRVLNFLATRQRGYAEN